MGWVHCSCNDKKTMGRGGSRAVDMSGNKREDGFDVIGLSLGHRIVEEEEDWRVVGCETQENELQRLHYVGFSEEHLSYH